MASFDIGGIGFASHRPILDIGGLSDPATASLLKSGTIWKYLRDRHIDHVVIPEEHEPSFPGPLNFGYRLHLLDNPALDLRLVRFVETSSQAWMPAIRGRLGALRVSRSTRCITRATRHPRSARPRKRRSRSKTRGRPWAAARAPSFRTGFARWPRPVSASDSRSIRRR